MTPTASVEPAATHLRTRYVVRPTEVATGTRLTTVALLDLFQDSAGRDADRLGFGMAALAPLDRAWVLHRVTLERLAPLPGVGEGLTLETWPGSPDGLFAARHARAFADDGTLVANLTTRWLYIEVARRRPLRTPPELLRHARTDVDAPLVPGPPPTAPTGQTHRAEMSVMRRDLDVMQHANNVCFVEWMLEALPTAVVERPLRALDIVIRSEALYGDALMTEAAPDPTGDDLWLHSLHRTDSPRPIATMRTAWAS